MRLLNYVLGSRAAQFSADLRKIRRSIIRGAAPSAFSVLRDASAAWDQRVIGVSFDGTGYGDDGTTWGGEIFSGSVREGFERVAHLRPATLPGGDAAAKYPVQAAAGFLAQLDELPDLTAPPFSFPSRYRDALRLANINVAICSALPLCCLPTLRLLWLCFHTRSHVRRPGRYVAGTPCHSQASCRCALSVSLSSVGKMGFSSAASSDADQRQASRTRTQGEMCARLPARFRAGASGDAGP